MSIFDIITLFGGLAMFLYGMRLMGDGLKESSSGTLKIAMEHITNNPLKAFALGLIVTAIIQSSTATIVITSGLVGAGILTLHQSMGIIIGANVGTTVTGQIIRLLDLDSSATSWLQVFRPSTLAPLALIIGIVLIMGFKFNNSKTIGNIAIGFGILFSGLLNMTSAVNVLTESGTLDSLFTGLGSNPVIGYITGAGVAFVLQSSSATIGILQAFSASGLLTFRAVYTVIVGVYLGDCVTTAIVCWIGAKAEARRVGIVNILFNFGKTVLVLAGVAIAYQLGLLDWIWNDTVNSGIIANTNTVFNLGCAVLLLPFTGMFEKTARKIVRDEAVPANKYAEKLDALSPAFFKTPALALHSCYDLLNTMFRAATDNVRESFTLLHEYNEKKAQALLEEENNIDLMADRLSSYLVLLSKYITDEQQVHILNQYHKVVSEFEHLGDQAENIAEASIKLHSMNTLFSEQARSELHVLEDLICNILEYTELAFTKRDVDAARHIEPLEEVVDDMVAELRENHLVRLRRGECSVDSDSIYLNVLSNIEHISDTCSNVGVATVARVHPELSKRAHGYVSQLHSGKDDRFNEEYQNAHMIFFGRLEQLGNRTA